MGLWLSGYRIAQKVKNMDIISIQNLHMLKGIICATFSVTVDIYCISKRQSPDDAM